MILGVDEVGRGCLAGPVVAGAVLLDKRIRGLRDSKKLTKIQRERFDLIIRAKALAFGIGWANAEELDTLGLTAAVRLAMERAVAEIELPYDELIIDGNYNFLRQNPKSRYIIKADDLIPAVSAASIIAKVARDRYMAEAALRYPGYFFEKHVGYGTPQHVTALQSLGLCDLHRRSFAPVRALLGAT
jgi:ribonuclease HII